MKYRLPGIFHPRDERVWVREFSFRSPQKHILRRIDDYYFMDSRKLLKSGRGALVLVCYYEFQQPDERVERRSLLWQHEQQR